MFLCLPPGSSRAPPPSSPPPPPPESPDTGIIYCSSAILLGVSEHPHHPHQLMKNVLIFDFFKPTKSSEVF
jgi:hypothetical protein